MEVGVTGAMLMGEEEGVAGAGPEKESSCVGRAVEANSKNCLFPVLQQLMVLILFFFYTCNVYMYNHLYCVL